jgi:hypothetical protein
MTIVPVARLGWINEPERFPVAWPWRLHTYKCSAVEYSAVQYTAVQCSAVQCAVQCSAVQCSAVQWSGRPSIASIASVVGD